MSSRGSAANLAQALKELNFEWQQTQEYWRDTKSLDFEKSYLTELPLHAARAAAVMEEIDNLLRKVRVACE